MKKKFFATILLSVIFAASAPAVTYIKLFRPDGKTEDHRDVKIVKTEPLFVEFVTIAGYKVIFSGVYEITELER